MNVLSTRLLAPLSLALALIASPLASHAEALAPPEADQVRDVILAQIQALADDDADRMFQTTTPAVREAIGSSGRFLAMVRGAYPMVYQPLSVTFQKPEKDGEAVLQMVQVTDQEERSWLAVFVLEQQADKSWGISGCAVAQNPWTPI
ncbi:MAG TPA: DUF4864 domain-containing protein [Ramlibacter sp.]|nr:DUF4864 domain-containing protein [Ramlibacter sp.]